MFSGQELFTVLCFLMVGYRCHLHTARAELLKSGSKLLFYEQLLFYTKKLNSFYLHNVKPDETIKQTIQIYAKKGMHALHMFC